MAADPNPVQRQAERFFKRGGGGGGSIHSTKKGLVDGSVLVNREEGYDRSMRAFGPRRENGKDYSAELRRAGKLDLGALGHQQGVKQLERRGHEAVSPLDRRSS